MRPAHHPTRGSTKISVVGDASSRNRANPGAQERAPRLRRVRETVATVYLFRHTSFLRASSILHRRSSAPRPPRLLEAEAWPAGSDFATQDNHLMLLSRFESDALRMP